jgi:hypothetical protein
VTVTTTRVLVCQPAKHKILSWSRRPLLRWRLPELEISQVQIADVGGVRGRISIIFDVDGR